MAISHLEHFLVVAQDYEATVQWYIDNLGFEEGPHPDFGADVEVTWHSDGHRLGDQSISALQRWLEQRGLIE